MKPNVASRTRRALAVAVGVWSVVSVQAADPAPGTPQVAAEASTLANPSLGSPPIQKRMLDPMQVIRLPIARDRLTTVRFPGPISHLESALVSTEPHPEALFLLSFHPGEAFFSLRALASGAATSLNVVWKKQTFVLELVESTSPWLSVVFEDPPPVRSQSSPGSISPSRLLGRLDLAKSYALLKQQHPSAVAGIQASRPNTLRDYGDYTIRTEEVFRFEADDTLVFRVVLRNKTSTPIQYLPASLMVRIGERIYHQSITDAGGVMPPGTDVPVYFALTGSADGTRADLSLKNDFFVLLNRIPQPSAPPLAQMTPVPAPAPSALAPSVGPTPRTPPRVPADPRQGIVLEQSIRVGGPCYRLRDLPKPPKPAPSGYRKQTF